MAESTNSFNLPSKKISLIANTGAVYPKPTTADENVTCWSSWYIFTQENIILNPQDIMRIDTGLVVHEFDSLACSLQMNLTQIARRYNIELLNPCLNMEVGEIKSHRLLVQPIVRNLGSDPVTLNKNFAFFELILLPKYSFQFEVMTPEQLRNEEIKRVYGKQS